MNSIGYLSKFTIRESKNLKRQVTYSFPRNVFINKIKKLELDFDEDREEDNLQGELLEWIPKNRLVKGNGLVEAWEKMEGRDNIVFLVCNIYQKNNIQENL
ncbi:MAG: hypothetical protein ACTSVI_04980 [Promethearchaeota archaeon]